MLRHPRRDRFAPHLPLEREHREAAFAQSYNRKTGKKIDGAEEVVGNELSEIHAQNAVHDVVETSHSDIERMLQIENADQLVQSSAFIDALGDIAHPPEVIVVALEADPQDRPEALKAILQDPAALLAAIQSLENQRRRHRELIETVEKTSTSGVKILPNSSVRDTLSRADAAESVRILMENNDQQTVEQWIAQAKPRDLQRLLGIEDRATAFHRLVALMQDQWHRATFRSGAWADADKKSSPKDLLRKQENYFAQVDRSIASLKELLKKELEKKADALEREMTREVRQGLSTLIGRDISALESVSPDAWNALDTKIESDLGVTLEDIFEQINAAADRCRVLRNLSASSDNFTAEAESLLTVNSGITWQQAVTEAQEGHKIVDTDIAGFLEAYDEIKPQLERDKNARTMLASITGMENSDEAVENLQEFANVLRDPNAKDHMSIKSRLIYSKALQLAPALRAMLRQGHHNIVPTQGATPSAEQFSLQSEKILSKVNEVEQLLSTSRIQQSFTCQTVGITEKLAEQVSSARANVRIAGLKFTKEGTTTEQMRSAAMQLAVIAFQMDQMEKALGFIADGIAKRPEVTQKPGRGYSDFGAHKYFVNPDAHRVPPPDGPINEADVARTVDHEFGHLVMDTLTERTHVLTGSFEEKQSAFAAFASEKMDATDNLETVLEKCATSWGMDRAAIEYDGEAIHAAGGAEAYYRRKRWEELLMKYATYRNKAETLGEDYNLDTDREFPSAEERRLLRLLDAQYSNGESPTVAKDFFAAKNAADARTALAFRNENIGADNEEEMDDTTGQTRRRRRTRDEENEERTPDETPGPTLDNFRKVREQIKFIGEFLHIYPEATTGWIGTIYNDAKDGYEKCFTLFDTYVDFNGKKMGPKYRPQEDQQLGDIVRNAINTLQQVEKEIRAFDKKNLESISGAKPEGKEFWLWVTRDIQWLSIMDYWTIAKESWEDVSRLWKRRGENARGKVGELITSWIGDRIPYFGQLKHEFHRRQQSSELEAVSVWEKALENVDSYKLIDEIEHVNNQDHLKAIMALLTKRGRLDWDDKKLWRALSRFSHFKIPESECERDPVLLDKWLQKVISNIWTDKELYRSWKNNNEHSYDSEREKFKGVADFYSNAGLLGSQLEYMLKTFVEAKDKKEPMPEQVNPHLYEELFLYGMERGKMSMQEKFFYLVQGLHHKIIPFERLAIINGKVSTDTFPFIDYFYQHNHTEAEIKELAISLQESEEQRFKPGHKTTAFLLEEVARDEQSRQRVTKLISRKGNNIDHEDIPMVTGYMTQGGWNNFLTVATGAVQRMTSEGLKNAYVGYSTLFKVYGMLAEKKERSGQHLAPSDVEFLAERIVAYTHYDNVVVRQTIDSQNRPKLSMREIENETMPSGDGRKAKEFRDPMNEFSFKVFEAYEVVLAGILDRGGKLKTDEDKGVPIDETASSLDRFKAYRSAYLGVDANGNKLRETPYGGGNKKGLRIFKMSYEVEDALIQAVKSDKGKKMIDILRTMAITENKFINEGGEDKQLSFDADFEKFNRQQRLAKANGGNQ